jgi:hypothetical protein
MIIVVIGGVVILSIFIFCLYAYFTFFMPLRKRESGFKYVFIQEDGTVRELNHEEEVYLIERFHPADGNRPYIKYRYGQRSPRGEMSGFILRRRIPQHISIVKSYGPA